MVMSSHKAKTGAVTDAQGRKRFHGAFTGGFSAGYFNTVGSEEGFQPATFRSSRSDRVEVKRQSVQDYMDEDDGLLGGVLTAKEGVDSFVGSEKSMVKSGVASHRLSDEIGSAISNIILEPANTMGKKLLGLLGWKPGQGTGPRIKRKDYFMTADTLSFSLSAVPTKALNKGVITFAPEDNIRPIILPDGNEDYRGIGCTYQSAFKRYAATQGSMIDCQHAKNSRYQIKDLFSKPTKTNMTSGLSQRYVDDDDDDHVYDTQVDVSINAIDTSTGLDEDIDPDVNTSLSTESLHKLCPSDHKPPLLGFHVSANAVEQARHYPPPKIPRDFNPIHIFPILDFPSSSQLGGKRVDSCSKVANRAVILGESSAEPKAAELKSAEPKTGSIFQLLRAEDQTRLAQLASNLTASQAAAVEERPMLARSERFKGLAEAFKSRFTTASSTLVNDGNGERKEGLMAGDEIQAQSSEKPAASSVQDAQQGLNIVAAAGTAAMPFQLVRKSSSWSPVTLLCKRCNVKVPDISRASSSSSSGKTPSATEAAATGDALLARLFAEDKSPAIQTILAGDKQRPAGGTEVAKERDVEGRMQLDVYLSTQPKPPMDLFRSIFADSDEEEEQEQDGSGAGRDVPGSIAQAGAEAGAEVEVAPATPRVSSSCRSAGPPAAEQAAAAKPAAASFVPRSQRDVGSGHHVKPSALGIGRGRSRSAIKPAVASGMGRPATASSSSHKSKLVLSFEAMMEDSDEEGDSRAAPGGHVCTSGVGDGAEESDSEGSAPARKRRKLAAAVRHRAAAAAAVGAKQGVDGRQSRSVIKPPEHEGGVVEAEVAVPAAPTVGR
jgi:hypothetical protein